MLEERSLTETELRDWIGYSTHAFQELPLGDPAHTPLELVERVQFCVEEWQAGRRPNPEKSDLIDTALGLGAVWGDQLVRSFGWEWIFILDGKRKLYAVASKDRALVIYPSYFIKACLDHEQADCTVLLSFNMLRNRKITGVLPHSYTEVNPNIERVVPGEKPTQVPAIGPVTGLEPTEIPLCDKQLNPMNYPSVDYPGSLLPITTEAITLPSGQSLQINKATPTFKPWRGSVEDTYGGKVVLDFYGKPEFAELGILRIFEQDDWEGVWVDTYGNKFRTHYWPPNHVSLPEDQALLLKSINKVAGSRYGCFDVFCWKGSNYVFVEVKRSGRDRIRESQKRWIQAALECGAPLSSLLIVEWKPRDAVKPC